MIGVRVGVGVRVRVRVRGRGRLRLRLMVRMRVSPDLQRVARLILCKDGQEARVLMRRDAELRRVSPG